MIDSYFVKKGSDCAKRKLDEKEDEGEPEMKAKVAESLNNSSCQAASSSKFSFLDKDRKMDLQ